MAEYTFNPDGWLNLGIAGAALFIVLILIILLFKLQGKNIDKLCEKLDSVTNTFAESNMTLQKVIICSDKDQKEILRHLTSMTGIMLDVHRRVVRVDTRLYEKKDNNQERT